jgi:hypothetical protein
MLGSVPRVVPAVTDLKPVHVAELQDGCWCFVQSIAARQGLGGFFYLSKNSGLADNGTTIIEPFPGSPIAGAARARWLICDCG